MQVLSKEWKESNKEDRQEGATCARSMALLPRSFATVGSKVKWVMESEFIMAACC